jgi:hypothetical protein
LKISVLLFGLTRRKRRILLHLCSMICCWYDHRLNSFLFKVEFVGLACRDRLWMQIFRCYIAAIIWRTQFRYQKKNGGGNLYACW